MALDQGYSSIVTDEALQASLSNPNVVDVKFWVFSRRVTSQDKIIVDKPLPVYGISSILKRTEYFKNLLSDGFNESQTSVDSSPIFPSTNDSRLEDYDYDSDSDLEDGGDEEGKEDEANDASSASSHTGEMHEWRDDARPLERKFQQVIIKDAAFLTWYSLLWYLYTGKVSFLPLTAADPPARKDRARTLLNGIADQQVTPACSPKSMYRLAEKLGIKSLENLAFHGLQSLLTPSTVISELFSKFTSSYSRIVQTQLDYLCEHYDDAAVSKAWPDVIHRFTTGETPYAQEAMLLLLTNRLTSKKTPFAQD